MTPLHISDPVLPHRDKRKKSKVMSGPMFVMVIAAVAGVPPIANRLVALDGTLHAHNDAIVSFIMLAAPVALIAFSLIGLWLMFGKRPPEKQAHAGDDSGFFRHTEGRP
jgi:hypothetical protein